MSLKNLKNPGLWLTLVVVFILGVIPIATNKASTREETLTVLLSVILVSSLNILLGYTGYISFGHIVFYGMGGYVGLFLISAYGWSLWTAMVAGGLASGLLAFLLGSAILRLRGSYFALATIGINEAMRAFISNFAPFGGPTGISLNFQVYNQYGGAAQALWTIYYVVLALALGNILLSYLVKTSKFGLGLQAIREDEDAAEVMGVVTPSSKTWAYVLSAVLPGVVGVLFFFKNGNIEPGPAFRLNLSIELLVMVMLGGYGTIAGPVLGAFGYQRLRGILLTSDLFKNIQLTVAGVLLLIIILFIPSGAVGWIRNRFPVTRRYLP
ncbi:MAG: branched-chain amino acid ABC transporter permease [Anaerolineaceae bacterium]|nr:branched-chain amino acid ABC transporter permease [Anaerolineaceae bacterium]